MDESKEGKKITFSIIEVVRALFPVMVFLSVFTLVFDVIQSRDSIMDESVSSIPVRSAQKQALYVSLIPAIMATFLFSNMIGVILLISCVSLKFLYTIS